MSYATNTMSFLRVGAYVLVHAGMMLVVFTLAEMSSGIGYVLVLIVGNAFVMGLEALLVAIQVLRLEYYEMFSRFYDGDGIPSIRLRLKSIKREYFPVSINFESYFGGIHDGLSVFIASMLLSIVCGFSDPGGEKRNENQKAVAVQLVSF